MSEQKIGRSTCRKGSRSRGGSGRITETRLPPEDKVLGRVNPQGSLLDPAQLFGHLVTKGSFYERLARCGHELVADDDFAHMYVKSRGRPSIPPSVMVRALLLAAKDDTSDRESAQRSRVDLDWKAALGLDADHPGIGATTFSLMRSLRVARRRPGVVSQDRRESGRQGPVPAPGPRPHRLLPGAGGRRRPGHL